MPQWEIFGSSCHWFVIFFKSKATDFRNEIDVSYLVSGKGEGVETHVPQRHQLSHFQNPSTSRNAGWSPDNWALKVLFSLTFGTWRVRKSRGQHGFSIKNLIGNILSLVVYYDLLSLLPLSPFPLDSEIPLKMSKTFLRSSQARNRPQTEFHLWVICC